MKQIHVIPITLHLISVDKYVVEIILTIIGSEIIMLKVLAPEK